MHQNRINESTAGEQRNDKICDEKKVDEELEEAQDVVPGYR